MTELLVPEAAQRLAIRRWWVCKVVKNYGRHWLALRGLLSRINSEWKRRQDNLPTLAAILLWAAMIGGGRRRTKGLGKAGVVKKCSTNGALSRLLPVGVTLGLRRTAKAMAASGMIVAHAFGFGKLDPQGFGKP